MALTAREDALGEIREHLAPQHCAGPGAGTKGILGLLRAAVGARANPGSIRDSHSRGDEDGPGHALRADQEAGGGADLLGLDQALG